MKKKFVVLALAVVMIAAFSRAPVPSSGANADEEEPFVNSWEATANMTDEELIAIGQAVLRGGQGNMPDHAFAACFRLEEIDPELAEACFRHIEDTALPAVKPKQRDTLLEQQSEKPGRFGVYIRDEDGSERYEYYDDKGSAVSSEAE